MAGGAFFVASSGRQDEEYDLDQAGTGGGAPAVQWVGKAAVKGPKWAKMPLLTVGMLGIQCVWSIEMGYASPYLLDLGLSKSFMSLVFMAGPLSGLLVQPLIGILADRSRSPWGRRRPFMIAGCLVCAGAMMLLGWAREIGGIFSSGTLLPIALAVWSIYLIDFSINAVMSADRALVVDTLPPSQQEEGSAWGGRMFGCGSVLGFFVGNLDLTPVLPFLGKTQIQILSFLTSMTLLLAHALTSWAVSERILLRDERQQARSTFWSNVKAIWDNMFTLPPGIQTVCIIQFFNFLGWFPVLFFTSVWVSEIYTQSVPSDGIDDKVFAADAVRAGNRALFFQALVTIVFSVAAPFFVSESGVQLSLRANEYESLNGHGGSPGQPRTPLRKFSQDRRVAGGSSIAARSLGLLADMAERVKEGKLVELPLRSLTLVKLWYFSMFCFALAMGLTWFVTTVEGAYFVIALTGVSWALTNWAPFSLIGELILIDDQIDRSGGAMSLEPILEHPADAGLRSPTPEHVADQEQEHHHQQTGRHGTSASSSRNSPFHSRHGSRSSLEQKLHRSRSVSPELPTNPAESSRAAASSYRKHTPTPLRMDHRADLDDDDSHENSLVLHHSDEDDEIDSPRTRSPLSPASPRVRTKLTTETSTADKAGVILGIHNVFVVLPQFIVTGLAAFIFWVMEPESPRGIPGKHPQAGPLADADAGVDLGVGPELANEGFRRLFRRAEGLVEGGSPDAVGLIFRIGGVSAAIGAVIAYRLSRRWARGEGI